MRTSTLTIVRRYMRNQPLNMRVKILRTWTECVARERAAKKNDPSRLVSFARVGISFIREMEKAGFPERLLIVSATSEPHPIGGNP